MVQTDPDLPSMPANRPERRRSRSAGFRRFGRFIPVLVILGASITLLIYLGLMQALGWGNPMLGANAAGAPMRPTDTLTLYASQSTRTYFAGNGGNFDTLLTPWRRYLTNRKLDYQEITEPARLREVKNGTLILPSSVALSEQERAELLAFRARGGSVLATWATGSRSETGAWLGWQFLESLGARLVGEIAPAAEIGYLVVDGESPVSHGHAAGQRIELSRTAEAFLRFRGDHVAARFMNWARITEAARRDEGAVLYTEPGKSRAVLFAFAESSWEAHPLNVYGLIDDAIGWLQREPAIVRAAWPKAQRAAEIIEMDTEENFANAATLGSMFKALDYRASFFVLTSVGQRFPAVLVPLARDFEIGFHGDVHQGFKGQAAALQQQRIDNMRAEMATVVPDTRRMTGFRAPLESYDATTEQLLQKAGIRYHVADPDRTGARLPLIAPIEDVVPEAALVVLPRTQRDDINLARQALDVAQTTQALIDDFDLVVANGALGLLSLHSQNFGSDATLVKAMPAFLEHVRKRRSEVWLASAGQVADWWRERERLALSSSNPAKRMEFNLTVRGNKPLSDVSLVMMLPQKRVMPDVRSMKVGLPAPTVTALDDYRALVYFSSLAPGNYSYQATFSQQ